MQGQYAISIDSSDLKLNTTPFLNFLKTKARLAETD